MRLNRENIASSLTLVFLFLLPWQARTILAPAILAGSPWEYGTVSVYATEILLWVTVLIALPAIVAWARSHRRVAGAVGLFLGYVVASTLWAPDRAAALMASLHLLDAAMLALLVATSTLGWRRMATAFVVGMVVQVFVALPQVIMQRVFSSTLFGTARHFPQTPGTSVVLVDGERFLRAYGTLPHPNILGGYLAIGALLVGRIGSYIRARSLRSIPVIFGTALLLVALSFTFSRSAILGYLAGLVAIGGVMLWDARGMGHIRGMLGLGMGLLIVLTTLFFLVNERATRIGGTGMLDSKSVSERIEGMRDAWRITGSHPWFGVGIGNYTVALATMHPERTGWYPQPVHNVPLLMVAELGILGMVVFVLLVWRIGSRLRLIGVDTISISLPIAIIVISLFDHYLWSLYSGTMLGGFVLGLALRRNGLDSK